MQHSTAQHRADQQALYELVSCIWAAVLIWIACLNAELPLDMVHSLMQQHMFLNGQAEQLPSDTMARCQPHPTYTNNQKQISPCAALMSWPFRKAAYDRSNHQTGVLLDTQVTYHPWPKGGTFQSLLAVLSLAALNLKLTRCALSTAMLLSTMKAPEGGKVMTFWSLCCLTSMT